MTTQIHPKLQELLARHAIHDALVNVCRGYDRCDPELMRSAYWPDATDDSGGSPMNALEWVDRILPVIKAAYHVSLHTISNVHIELDGERAWVESYLVAHELHNVADVHVGRASVTSSEPSSAAIPIEGEIDCTGMIRFLDRFEKRGEEWRIAERRAVLEMNRYVPSSVRWDVSYTRTRSARYPDDPWYDFVAGKTRPE